ncbi:ArsC family reductase [Motiliproteus sp. MSK22-1]|uniref:ArsC family reductase n=1 Tax=Motiliproteus sp. MSK22-1 TaxID=1897630 RepID=UPI0009784490|nr:ArsC family reductase [Motiliproteus sp. MSK22-1]OMH39155.1 arsenate reductase [Motiliproteus sp. MSK22-1]
MITLYGINNCDTIRKARKWLQEEGIDYRFHDYRKDGLNAAQLNGWADELGWEALLNRRGTTWRQLPQEQKDAVTRDRAIDLMLAQPAMIKRPLLDLGEQRKLGFSVADYSLLFEKQAD